MSRITTAPWANTMRGFAMVLIVFGHTIGYCYELRGLTEYLSSFYVPLFFVISGYLFTYNPQESLLSFMKRKAVRILIPYYIFALASLLPFYLFSSEVQGILSSHRDIDNPFLHCLFHVFYASGHNGGLAQNSPLWFLPCYYAVIVLAKLVSENIRIENKLNSLKLASGFLCIGYIVYRHFNYAFPYCLETALIMLFFFFLGKQIRVSHLALLRNPLIPAGLLLLGFVAQQLNGKVSCMTNSYSEHFIIFVIAATCSSMGYLLLFSGLYSARTSRRFENAPLDGESGILTTGIPTTDMVPSSRNRLLPFSAVYHTTRRLLSYLGIHTIPFLVMHKMPIVFFQAKMPYVSDWLRFGSASVQFVTAVGVATVSILLCWIVYKVVVRWAPWVFGE